VRRRRGSAAGLPRPALNAATRAKLCSVSRNRRARWTRAGRIAIATASVGLALAPALAPASPNRAPINPDLASDAAAVEAELSGIPQQGLTLGSSSAPVTVVEYTDLLCQPCATAATKLLAPVIGDYVRQGTVSLELAPITLSQLSSEYAYGAYSAALQGKGWDYVLLAYARSSRTGDGPSDSPAAIASALHLNVRRWRKNLFRPRWANTIRQTVAVVSIGNFTSFPVFTVRGLPGANGRVSVKILRPPVSLPALTAAIAGAQGSGAPTG
jgi:Thioredoxin